MSLEEDRDSVLSDFEDARSEPDRSRVVRETSPVTAELSAEQSQLPAGEPGVSGGPPGSSPAAPQLSADAKLHDTAWVAAGGGADHESAGSGDGEAESEEDDLYFDEDGAATDEEAEAGLHAHSAGPHRSGPTRSSTAHSSHSSHDAEGGAESAYDDAYGDAAAGAGHDDDADEEEGSAGGSDQGYPDLVLSDGRVLRRRVRPRTEADELEDGKKDAAMAGAMKEEGNRHFAAGTFDTAAACYTEALRYVPRDAEYCEHRAVYFGNRAACYLQLDRTEDALYDCDRAIEENPRYLKAVARRSGIMEKLGKLDEALADAQLWLAGDPRAAGAREAVARLKKAAAERDEKLKEEMMGKLKDMGNWVLGKFGLSVDNFKAVQDPKTGSYSISFQQ